MTRFAKTLTFICLIVILFLGYIVYHTHTNKGSPLDANPPISTSSINGCYVAHLAKDVYTLNIESEQNGSVSGMLSYHNYEKDSSSGAFSGNYKDGILLGNYSFDSEGMHSERQVIFKRSGDDFIQGFGPVKVVDNKEVFDDISKVTYDPKSTFVKSEDCLEHFKDSNNTFSFDYNAFFFAIEGDKNPTTLWRVSSKDKGILLASVFVPKTYMSGTNFSEAKFTIGRSSDVNAIKSCTSQDNSNNDKKSGTAALGSYPFTKFASSDAGAGNFYETTSYRGIVDGDCYAIEYTIHSTNIGNYPPDQGIKEFDKSKIQNELEKIFKSLKFSINSN